MPNFILRKVYFMRIKLLTSILWAGAAGLIAAGCAGPVTPAPQIISSVPEAPPIDQIDRLTPQPSGDFVYEGGAWEREPASDLSWEQTHTP